jgi:hypothetical protein
MNWGSALDVSSRDREEIKKIKDLSPNHVVPFIGACLEPLDSQCIILQVDSMIRQTLNG